MKDRELFAKILDLAAPWTVLDVALDAKAREVRIKIQSAADAKLTCPTCGKPAPGYDSRSKQWRHLDTCQYQTILEAEVPRVKCSEHGVVQVHVPWAEPGSRFTAMFVALMIDLLKEASIDAVADLMGVTWSQVDTVMKHAVKRGLARRKHVSPTRLGVDETSFQKRHEYVTVVSDQVANAVVYVADDRKTSSLDGYYQSLTPDELHAIEVIAMDMCAAYIASTRTHVPDADAKICFDRFHVAQLLSKAVDECRRKENRVLRAKGDESLSGSRFVWLTSPEKLSDVMSTALEVLKDMALKTSRAWAIKEMASNLWHYSSRIWARKGWERWLSWATRCRIDPIKKAAGSIRKHLEGILNAIVLKATNAGAESINGRIQDIKRRACGFRSRERFRNAIYFHLGNLDLYPAQYASTHTES